MPTIQGNTHGLAPSQIQALERIYRRKVPFDQLTTTELTRSLVDVSHATGRQVGVLVDRTGLVHHVIVGDASKLMLPDVGRLRAGAGRLRGLRLIHTHLNNEPLTRDDIVDLTKLRLDLIAAICLAPGEARPLWVYYGHNVPPHEDQAGYRTYGPISYPKLDVDPGALIGALEEEFARAAKARPVRAKDGRALLIHVTEKRRSYAAKDSLRELQELARTAGVEVADTILQIRDRVDPKYVLGKGKLEDVVIRAMQHDAEVLIFDRDLTPAQAAAVAGSTELKVIDRTQLILDIFAQRAHSRDGKLQVELAQMKYLLPRLGQRDNGLSRLTGVIGGRGPGETKLEIGRRRARERIDRLRNELKRLEKQRKQRRSSRNRRDVLAVAIVGYTNAGKSTLLNTLTGADVLAEDKLFATLDTRTRRYRIETTDLVLTDTVGFIRDLPKDLFAAFRATFEEAEDADLLLHVVDAADPAFEEHIETTLALLEKLELDHIPRLLVLNKADQLNEDEAAGMEMLHDGVAVSALKRDGYDVLRREILKRLRATQGDRGPRPLEPWELPAGARDDSLDEDALDEDASRNDLDS